MSRSKNNGDEEESYIHYGTPLENQDELGRRKGKLLVDQGQARRVAPWQQEVTDSEGRKRFHGAFTGGFSAGYYNTVGSKEGWAPSSFTSSRNQRAGKKEQLIYDFLDEDEKEEFKSKELSSTAEFDTFGSTAAELARRTANSEYQKRPSAIPGAIPDEIIVPSAQSIGVKLLVKMGWRQGRDIGADHFPPASAGEKGFGLGVKSLEKLDQEDNADIPTDFGVDEESEDRMKAFQKRSMSEMLDKKADSLPSFHAATHTSLDVKPLRFSSPLIPAEFSLKHVLPPRLDIKQYLENPEPPEVPSPDLQLTKAINGVAAFVAKSGQRFEDMLKQKHLSNPQFSFLIGGTGHTYYLRRLWEEQQTLAKLGKEPIGPKTESRKDRQLLGDQRGRILGETPMPRTESTEASLIQSDAGAMVSLPSSSLVPFDAASELSAQMSSRFTSAASDTGLGPAPGKGWDTDLMDSIRKEVQQIRGRVEASWRPTALLCKRFNLPDPHFGQSLVPPKPKSGIELLNISEDLFEKIAVPLRGTPSQASASATEGHRIEDVRTGDTLLEGSIDLYKAIFSDDDDDSDDENMGSPSALLAREIGSKKKLVTKQVDAAALNARAAGEFLESLGKELGLRV